MDTLTILLTMAGTALRGGHLGALLRCATRLWKRVRRASGGLLRLLSPAAWLAFAVVGLVADRDWRIVVPGLLAVLGVLPPEAGVRDHRDDPRRGGVT